jgi:hypothetical protein
MHGRSVSRILVAAIPIILVSAIPIMIVGFVPAGTPAVAQSDTVPSGRQCSDRTLFGDYGFAVEGLALPAPGVALPGRGVTMTHFDGEGNLTQVDSLLINGTPVSDWSTVTGTYQVNANCTGTMSLLPSAGGFVNLRIVVVRHGTEIHTVVWPPFDGPARTITSVGIKVQ